MDVNYSHNNVLKHKKYVFHGMVFMHGLAITNKQLLGAPTYILYIGGVCGALNCWFALALPHCTVSFKDGFKKRDSA